MCFAGGAAVSEFSAARPRLQTGSSSAAVVNRAREEADSSWGSEQFETHKTAMNQVTSSAAPQRPLSISKATGKKKGNPEKTQAEGREGNGAMQQNQSLPLGSGMHLLHVLAAPAMTIC